jgi:RNA 2',3'-cyclic 3'-phosphodiesterase
MERELDDSPFVRTFLAIEISESLRASLAEAQAVLRRSSADVAWVRPAAIHLSLHFLGDVVSGRVALLAEAIDRAAAECFRFEFQSAGVGYFGSARSPRVLWAAVAPSAALSDLHRRAGEALRELGLPLDERLYRPHLTLGRVRSARGSVDLMKAVVSMADRAFGDASVSEVVLFRSRLLPQGAEHLPLHRAALTGA